MPYYTDLGLGFTDQVNLRTCKNLTNKKAEQALKSHDRIECFNITSVNLGEPFCKVFFTVKNRSPKFRLQLVAPRGRSPGRLELANSSPC